MADHYVNIHHTPEKPVHEGWVEYKSFHDTKWKKCWLQLAGNSIYFYNSQNSTEPPTGMVNLESDFKFEKKDGSEKMGYKFDVYTNRCLYKFKASKFSEREQWKAYLEGIAAGKVSDNIDLPEEYLNKIRQSLNLQQCADPLMENSGSISMVRIEGYRNSSASGVLNFLDNALNESDSGIVDLEYVEPIPSLPFNSESYIFHNDPSNPEIPSWFFQNCSREMAMEILNKGVQYGNTLMRKGTTVASKLVISKKMESGKEIFTHYEVVIHPDGYKLNVENPHLPMKTLTQIMNFFVQTSGVLNTKPMTCNNLQTIGISSEHDYNPLIVPSSTQSSMQLLSPREESLHYRNLTSQIQKKKALLKNRSQSIPDIMPEIMKLNEQRKMSAGFIDSEEINLATSNNPVKNPTLDKIKASHSLDIPDIPPQPPKTTPPALPNKMKNKTKVTSQSNSPPPLPPNHPPPLKSISKNQPAPAPSAPSINLHREIMDKIGEKDLAAKATSGTSPNVKKSPPVAQKPPKKCCNDIPNDKMVGDVPVEEFKNKLEELFGGSKAKTLPMPKKISPHKSDAVSFEVGPPHESQFEEDMYSILDYQNSEAVKDFLKKN